MAEKLPTVDLFDEHDLACLTRRSVASVRRDRLLRRGCPYIKIGAAVRYRRSDFEHWLASLEARGGTPAQHELLLEGSARRAVDE